MTVNEVRMKLGSWNLRLRPETPRAVLNAVDFMGHVVIFPGRVDVRQYGDQLLSVARYVGVNRTQDAAESRTIAGVGMAFWLGDEEGKGDVFETAVELDTASFAASIAALLPPGGAVTAGTIHGNIGTYTGRHQWQTPRTALDYVTSLFETEWRVNGNGTLDAGTPTQLGYAITPRALVLPSKVRASRDLVTAALPGRTALGRDVADYSTRVVVLAEGEGESIATGSADAVSVPYNDIHGNDVVLTRLASESSTNPGNADARAELILAQYAAARATVRLSSSDYDVKGDVTVGDWIWVYDPDNGYFDLANELAWEGETINPIKLRLNEMAWPVRAGWTVAYRTSTGVWLDLSDFYYPESGDTTLVVGEPSRSLSGIGSEPIGSRPSGDSSIPDVPAFTDFSVGAYQSGATNTTKAAIRATWTTPLNTDGSVILDGDRYEIRYRVDEIIGYAVRWAELGPFRWGDDPPFTWGAPLSEPVEDAPEWQTAIVGWGTNAFTLTELTPGVQYELQIRAVDSATPPHFGAWSTSSLVLASGDLFAPSAPAAPLVAGSRVSVQVTHNLGKNAGGTFNLEQDLDHLEVHLGGSADFLAIPTTMIGKLTANAAMLGASIPAVGTFNIEQTGSVFIKVVAVDRAGNKSDASPGSPVTALLIDNAHISDLSVSKLTAGTITANSILAAAMEVGLGGNIILNEGAVLVRDALGRTIMEMGKRTIDPAGGFGLSVFNANDGSVAVRMGETADPNFRYGVEAVNNSGQLVSLQTLAFGMSAARVDAYQTTNSTTYADLSTLGPEVSTYIGSSGRCIVFIIGHIQEDSTSIENGGVISFNIAGPTNVLPDDFRGLKIAHTDDGVLNAGGTASSNNLSLRVATAEVVSGLSPGYYTFTLKYRVNSSGDTITFGARQIIVIPY